MTSVNIANYGSICISEKSEESEVNTRRQEEEGSRHVSMTEKEETHQELLPRQEEEEEEEETHQDLLPQQESWTSRHKQFIGLFQKVTRVYSKLEMFRSWPLICCWRIVHSQQLCDKSVACECAGPAPGQNSDADADLFLNMLLQVVLTDPNAILP